MHLQSSVTCLILNIIAHYFTNRPIVWNRFIELEVCILKWSTNKPEIFFFLTRTEGHTIKNVYWSSHKLPVIFVIS
jgi:hypothetical protein